MSLAKSSTSGGGEARRLSEEPSARRHIREAEAPGANFGEASPALRPDNRHLGGWHGSLNVTQRYAHASAADRAAAVALLG